MFEKVLSTSPCVHREYCLSGQTLWGEEEAMTGAQDKKLEFPSPPEALWAIPF